MAEYSNEQRSPESRAIANNRSRSTGGTFSFSPVQRMVAVPELGTSNDLFLLSHIDWALKTTGGALVDLNKDDIQGIGNTETLHLVEHGNVGSIGGWPAWFVLNILGDGKKTGKGLPVGYSGEIKVTSCFSDVDSASGANDSLVKKIRNGLKTNFPSATVIGYPGPTVTNAHASVTEASGGIITIKPSDVPTVAGLQTDLEAKYCINKGSAPALTTIKGLTGAQKSSAIAKIAFEAEKIGLALGPFYKEFMKKCITDRHNI